MRGFSVELAGSFHTFKLLDARGHEITNVREAAAFAECEFSGDWQSVFNGDEALSREDYLFVTVDPQELLDNGYTNIVSQDGDGGVVLCTDGGTLEHFAVRDSVAGWCLDTDDGRVLEFCRSIKG